MEIKIGNKKIGKKNPVFIIAEGGINHNGSIKIAKKIISKAKEVGADAIKFQTFKAEDLASEKSEYFKLFKKLELEDHEFGEIADYAKEQKIEFLSTPFSKNAVDLLENLDVSAFKIASGDLTHIPLIQYAAQKKKPMIISTGLARMNEVREAVKAIENCKNYKIIILHSVSAYPTPPNEVNLRVIQNLKKEFPYEIGYSDNGSESLSSIGTVFMGGKIIEKHFTINKKLKGPDHLLSSDPNEFHSLTKNIRLAESILGDGIKQCQPSELRNKTTMRRSITVTSFIKKGTKLNSNLIDVKRPATGIEPKYYNKIIGYITKKNIKQHESLKWNDIYKK